jgi:putative spermidine/putrescine transport system substrate-binding protein
MRINSRTSIAVALIAAAAAFSIGKVRAAEQVVVSSWGGTFQDAQRKAFFEPFEKATGIKVVEATQPYGSKIKAMVQSGNVEWDVAEVVPADLYLLDRENMLEKIDYSVFDKKTLDALEEGVALPTAVGTISYGRVIAWNTRTFPPGKPHPETFADVWDVKKFPGKRVLDAGDYTFPPIEYALLADGVKPSELYPLDLKRAYASLSRIRPYVLKWAKGSSAAPEALVDDSADIAVVSHGRIAQLKKDGAKVDFTFNQDLLKRDYFVVPKGAKNAKNAMKFIAFVSQARQIAALCSVQPFGSPNKDAYKYISPEIAKGLPTSPQNAKTAIMINDKWWAETDPATKKSWRELNVEEWNKWVIQK